MTMQRARSTAGSRPGRPVLEGVTVHQETRGVTVEVRLRHGGQLLTGSASDEDRRWAIATATLTAAVSGSTRRPAPILRQVERHRDLVVVRATVDGPAAPVQLVGAAAVSEREDPVVARATLDATNRYLGAGLSGRGGDDPELVAVVAHQIRSPLTVVHEMLDTVLVRQDRLDAGTLRELLERALAQTDTLLDRVDALLAGAGARPGPVVVDVVTELQSAIRDAGAADEVSITAPPRATAVMHPGHLREVAEILISNAVEHGRPPVSVTVEAGADTTVVTVEDRGPGVPEDLVSRLFTTAAGTTRTGGHGVGLAAAHGLARANGGTLVYETGTAGGARFVLTIPASAPPAPGIPPA